VSQASTLGHVLFVAGFRFFQHFFIRGGQRRAVTGKRGYWLTLCLMLKRLLEGALLAFPHLFTQMLSSHTSLQSPALTVRLSKNKNPSWHQTFQREKNPGNCSPPLMLYTSFISAPAVVPSGRSTPGAPSCCSGCWRARRCPIPHADTALPCKLASPGAALQSSPALLSSQAWHRSLT
jgi:hypothetical protein